MDEVIADSRVRCHVMLHEYETLLYVDPTLCGTRLSTPNLTTVMTAAVAVAGEPELVNDGPNTAPSKRIQAVYPGYAKSADGPTLAEEIGLVRLRSSCPHFAQWIDWLETL